MRISRLAAEHFWPAWPNAERTTSRIAASMSAASVTTMAFLPLVSASRRSRGFQPRNNCAVSYEPVSTTVATSSWVIRRRPTSSSGQATYCRTSRGTPARQHWLASSQAVWRVSGGGLRITVLPAIRAASTPPAGIAYGKFHGDATTTTPYGRGAPGGSSVVA